MADVKALTLPVLFLSFSSYKNGQCRALNTGTVLYLMSQAYEKRQRGEKEEEEREDEIFSHKTVVTKFLNKVCMVLEFFFLN